MLSPGHGRVQGCPWGGSVCSPPLHGVILGPAVRCAHGQGAALWAGAGGMSTAEGTRSSFGGKGAAVPPGGGGTMGTAGHRAPRGASPAPLKPPAHGDVAPGPAVPLPGPVPGWRRGAPSPLCPPAGYRHGGHRGCTGPQGQGLFGENPRICQAVITRAGNYPPPYQAERARVCRGRFQRLRN